MGPSPSTYIFEQLANLSVCKFSRGNLINKLLEECVQFAHTSIPPLPRARAESSVRFWFSLKVNISRKRMNHWCECVAGEDCQWTSTSSALSATGLTSPFLVSLLMLLLSTAIHYEFFCFLICEGLLEEILLSVILNVTFNKILWFHITLNCVILNHWFL